jgi:uncharacterized membrane protein (UPF0127 family)
MSNRLDTSVTPSLDRSDVQGESLGTSTESIAAVMLLESGKRTVVCERCTIADTPAARLRGLLGRKRLTRGEGILLEPARSIHTAFMLFPIDAVFLNGDLEVVDVRPNLRAWRAAGCRGAQSVLELAGGEAERRGVKVGDRLQVFETPPPMNSDFADLFERVGVMLSQNLNDGSHKWEEVELLLMEGFSHTLALESERMAIEERLSKDKTSRRRRGSALARSLADRLEAIDRDFLCLRALLAELLEHGSHLRDSAAAERRAEASASRAA